MKNERLSSTVFLKSNRPSRRFVGGIRSKHFEITFFLKPKALLLKTGTTQTRGSDPTLGGCGGVSTGGFKTFWTVVTQTIIITIVIVAVRRVPWCVCDPDDPRLPPRGSLTRVRGGPAEFHVTNGIPAQRCERVARRQSNNVVRADRFLKTKPLRDGPARPGPPGKFSWHHLTAV